MGILERLENLIQSAVEGSSSSVMRQKLKPVEIENQLERAMRDNAQPSRGGRLAPNSFTVWVHPDAFRETIAGVEGYNRHCELLLNQFATQHGYKLLQPRISVAFDTDASLGRRDVRVDAGFDAPPPAPRHQAPPPSQNRYTHTQVIQSASAERRVEASRWKLRIVQGRDAGQVLSIPMGEMSIGRSSACDIVLRDDSNTVSRQHAIITNLGHELRLRDNGSRNGTKVNGNYVPIHVETLINHDTEITFGECVVRAQMDQRRENW